MFQGWLERTTRLQRQFHPDGLPAEGSSEWRTYIEYNVVALLKELGELLAEVQTSPWKPIGISNRAKAWEEYVDVLHFAANIGVAIGLNDENLDDEYLAKMDVNYNRLTNGRSTSVRLKEAADEALRPGQDSHPVYGPHAGGRE